MGDGQRPETSRYTRWVKMIRKYIQLYFKFIRVSVKSQMQYKSSFVMLSLAHLISTFVDILGIWVLFSRFNLVKGWSIQEVCLIYGIIHMGFALAEALGRGLDTFDQMVKYGEFDRVLLRPLPTLLQVGTQEFQLMRIGRFLQGLFVLLWGCHKMNISLLSFSTLTIFASIVGTCCLFGGLFILRATLAFWTTEGLEVMNIATYGGVEAGQYPMTIYHPLFKAFFTFIIPLAFVAYFPVAVLLGHEKWPVLLSLLFPMGGVLFLLVSFHIWSVGVRRYHSAGN